MEIELIVKKEEKPVDKKWFALYTKPRWEKKVNLTLLKKGIEVWCPVQKVQKQWSDRKKIVEEPLFKSYVFVKINEAIKNAVVSHKALIESDIEQQRAEIIGKIENNNI